MFGHSVRVINSHVATTDTTFLRINADKVAETRFNCGRSRLRPVCVLGLEFLLIPILVSTHWLDIK